MISLTIVVLTFLLVFGAIYLIVKANKRPPSHHSLTDRKKSHHEREEEHNHPSL